MGSSLQPRPFLGGARDSEPSLGTAGVALLLRLLLRRRRGMTGGGGGGFVILWNFEEDNNYR